MSVIIRCLGFRQSKSARFGIVPTGSWSALTDAGIGAAGDAEKRKTRDKD